jgi:uncharacterized protein
MRIIPWAELSDAPWKNGGGITREIVREPATGSKFAWRVSVAEVRTEGTFSIFPGCERHIAVIKGDDGMTLDFGDNRLGRLDLWRPHTFSGDDHVSGLLPFGPVSDINLIVQRSFGDGKLTFYRLSDASFQPGLAAEHRLVHVAQGSCQGMGVELGSGDSLCLYPGEHMQLTGKAILAIASIRED